MFQQRLFMASLKSLISKVNLKSEIKNKDLKSENKILNEVNIELAKLNIFLLLIIWHVNISILDTKYKDIHT